MSAGSNKFGELFQWTTFGESHGPAMGVVIDGCPAGVSFDHGLLQKQLDARRPGQKGTTARQELDQARVLSGVFEGQTLGTPIAVIVENQDARSKDYSAIKKSPRTGHADDVWQSKFDVRDHRGGGRASARETLNWVIAGSVAQMFLSNVYPKLKIESSLVEVGGESVNGVDDPALMTRLEKAKEDGESFGALIVSRVQGMAANLGEPVSRKLKSELAHALMGVNATCSFEIGGGKDLAQKLGSVVHTKPDSDVYGGQRGGISTGEDLVMQLGFKPTASIGGVAQKGRHDPCVAMRALPIIDARIATVLADLELSRRLNRL